MSVREAAERDCDIAFSRLSAWVRDHGDAKPREFIGDLSFIILLAKEYLSEHPADDDEPVTDAILDLNFRRLRSGRWMVNSWCYITRCENGYFPHTYSGGAFRELKVLRDIRRLCAALGIELKETL